MAQLKDSAIDGNLEVAGYIALKENGQGIRSIHPETGENSSILFMNSYGNTAVGRGGYDNENGSTLIYGHDIKHYVSSVGKIGYCPYYKAGDVIDFTGNAVVRTAGYVTSSGKNVIFTIPITKPVIGTPAAIATSGKGFILRQGGKYTHGCDGATTPSATYIKPTSYSIEPNYNCGFIVTAVFDVATNVTNNDAIGIYWDGTITLS